MAPPPEQMFYWPKVANWVPTHQDTYADIDPTKTDLSGKSVLVTGASKGLGRATAISFAKAGASRIAVGARSPLGEVVKAVQEAAVAAGRPAPHVLALDMDVASEPSVRAAAERVRAEFGGVLDILVNNAGMIEKWVPMGETDPAVWWQSWEVNMHGKFLCCHYFMPMLLASPTKLVVNTSGAGSHNANVGASACQSASLATCRFTQFVVNDYYDQGVIAVSLHPGGVMTEQASNMPEQMHGYLVDTPELCADFTVWLGAERREWLAGRFLNVKWDVKSLEARKQEIVEKDLLKFRMAL